MGEGTLKDIIIRKAEIADAEAIVRLEEGEFSFPHSKEQIINEICDPQHYIIIADSNDSFAAYAGMYYIIDEAYITNVIVDTEFRRKHIADMLIDDMICFCHTNEITSLSLEVRQSNIPAIELYKKHSFNIEAVLKNYYSNPKENAYIMTNRSLN